MIIILADDLTGATDTGIQFQKRGIPTSVLVDGQHSVCRTGCPAVSINVDSRVLNGRDAFHKTFDILRKMPLERGDLIYKKVDSLMRGNPAEELDAVMQASGRTVALLAPSFPSMGRIVRNGVLHMPDGSQRDLLEEIQRKSQFPVTLIDLEQLHQSCSVIQSRLANVQQPHIFLFDAQTQEDLRKIASIGDALVHPIYCGSAGLAENLQVFQPSVLKTPPRPSAAFGKTLIVTGSRKRETAEQILCLKKVCRMEELMMSTQHHPVQSEIAEAATALSQKLSKSTHGAILTLESLFNSQTDFQDESPDVKADAHLFAEALGRTVSLVDPARYEGMILIGGDTAFHICRFLKVHQIDLLSEIQCGMPVGVFSDGVVRGKFVVTKSGAFGGSSALVSAWTALQNPCVTISSANALCK